MPVVIRRIVDDRFKNFAEVAPYSWDLRTQIEALEEWMVENGQKLNLESRWVADVGFAARLDAS